MTPVGLGDRGIRYLTVAAIALAVALPGVPRQVAGVDPAIAGGAIVRVAAGQSENVAAFARRAGATDVRSLGALDVVTAHLDATATRALAAHVSVKVIAADAVIRASDLRMLDTPPLAGAGIVLGPLFSTYQTANSSVTVAVVDSGVADSADLAGKVVARVNFVNDGAVALDPGGHGTFIAGAIAGSVTGVDPNATLVSLRVLGESGSGSARDALAAFDWLLRHRTDYRIAVVNLSWGATQTTSYNRDVLEAAVESLWFAGMTVVAAAGNRGPLPGTVDTPAADPFVIAVGSAKSSDEMSEWSSRGPTLDGFIKPDVLARGEQIVSLRVPGSFLDRGTTDRDPALGAAYTTMSGTSVATAVISGVAALLLQRTVAFTPTVVKTAVVSTGQLFSGSSAPELVPSRAVAFSANATGSLANAGLHPSTLLLQVAAPTLSGSNLTWENITWENITWETITWETVTWETITWEARSGARVPR